MLIGERLRQLREVKKLPQGDLERRTGLLRCYLSRVECGHTTPSLETLEKFARALEVPIYQIFYEGERPPAERVQLKQKDGFGSNPREAKTLDRFRRLLARTKPADRQLLVMMASKMAGRKKRKGASTRD
jgi:transcriptional regulator with XRE-family HTH domain